MERASDIDTMTTNEISVNNPACEYIDTQAVIIGAGPVGLFSVFELGLLDISCHVVDVLLRPGGQCAELYPDKPIYDIPALPIVTGRDLSERLMQQIEPFSPRLHFGETISSLEGSVSDGFCLHSSSGKIFRCAIVVIATGGGLFVAKKPSITDIERYEDTSVFYAIRDKRKFLNKSVVISGGGDSALDWALELCGYASKVTLLHRRSEFRAAPASIRKFEELLARGKIDFVLGSVDSIEGSDTEAGVISRLVVREPDGKRIFLSPIDFFLPFFGLTMRPGPITDFSLDMSNEGIIVDTHSFESSREGIFAIGDISDYRGKLKLILSGFHESALMAHKAHEYVYPGRKLRFQHTTSSSSLRKKLTGA